MPIVSVQCVLPSLFFTAKEFPCLDRQSSQGFVGSWYSSGLACGTRLESPAENMAPADDWFGPAAIDP